MNNKSSNNSNLSLPQSTHVYQGVEDEELAWMEARRSVSLPVDMVLKQLEIDYGQQELATIVAAFAAADAEMSPTVTSASAQSNAMSTTNESKQTQASSVASLSSSSSSSTNSSPATTSNGSNEVKASLKPTNFSAFLPVLHWPGAGTRWRAFLSFLKSLKKLPDTPKQAFHLFAQQLGRVTSYRALSLTEAQFQTIIDANSIYPTGRLKTTEEALLRVVNVHGVRKVAYARLYISRQRSLIGPADPSLSLHDFPEIAVCIAEGYMQEKDKAIYLMKLNVPLIEVLGYRLMDIQDGDKRWFEFRGIWFSSFEETTERYTLYEVPFLSKRCSDVRVFKTKQQVASFLLPYKQQQEQARLRDMANRGPGRQRAGQEEDAEDEAEEAEASGDGQ